MKPARLIDQRAGWLAGLKPDPVLTVSEWADDKRVLNQRSAAEPGKWRTSRTPYLRQIMDDLSAHSSVERVTFMKGAQIGGTEAGNNWIGYLIDQAPGPIMVVQPTVDMAKRWSKQRLAPMIEDMPSLREKIKDSRSRDSGNTTLSKEFDGGILIAAGANSAAGLRSMPVKYLMLDEVDAYPADVDEEGDPVELAINRTKTFARRKILEISTPTRAEFSRIDKSYRKGDMRRWHVPCPECQEKQPLELKNLDWQKDDEGNHQPDTVKLICTHCGALIDEHHKTWMLENGEWVAEGTPNDKHHSYHMGSYYSPLGWESWVTIVEKFIAAKSDASLLKTFTNTIDGLPFEEAGDRIDRHALQERAEDYPLRTVPMGALVLTCGVDVQDNRLELVTWGHGPREKWPIDYQVFFGNPSENEVWQRLDEYLNAPFQHAAGTELLIRACAVDSGGHHTQRVYDFCRLRKHRHVIAVKGSSTAGRPIIGRPSKVDLNLHGKTITNGAEVWMVGTDTAKHAIYSRLKIAEPQADGYMHFSRELPAEFYLQLTAERINTRYVKGFPVMEWTKLPGVRNEVLDCTVYNEAAFYHLGLHRWRPSQWKQLEERIQPATADLFGAAAVAEQAEQVEETAASTVKAAKGKARSRRAPRRGRGFVSAGLHGGMHGG